MLIETPIYFRDGIVSFCSHCNTEQKETIGMPMHEYFFYAKRLDDGLIQFEDKYFNEKYMVCTNCGNICEVFSQDNTKHFDNPKIQEILKSNKQQVEKNFIIMHIIYDNYKTLLDLYHYYQFINNEEEIKKWRTTLLNRCEKAFKETDLLYYLRMMIELHRRNGEFDTALKLIKTEYNRVKKLEQNTSFSKENNQLIEHQKIKEEKRLCKAKNSDIAILDISPKFKI